jgi:hypothetical protein
MTLRQDYARPRPRAIARHRDQPGRAAAPAHPGPAGISPPREPAGGLPRGPRRRVRIQRAVTAGSGDRGRFLWVSCECPADRSVW